MNISLASFYLLPLTAFAADTNELPPLIPAYNELPPTFWQQHQVLIIVIGFTFLAVAILILKKMLRTEARVVLQPEIVARQSLVQLLAQPEDGRVLSEVSQILRRYVIATFQLPAAELTTAEFCAVISGNEKIGDQLAQDVSNFLRECDERKFSMAQAAAPLNAAVRALELVNLAKKKHALRSVSGEGRAP